MSACTTTRNPPRARGMIFIHSAPTALCPHLERATTSTLGTGLNWQWNKQHTELSSQQVELSWTGPTSPGARFTSRLTEFVHIRFEVTEEAMLRTEGTRYCYIPSLGLFVATVGVHDDILVPENRIRHTLGIASAKGMSVYQAMGRLFRTAWDEELEQFRYSSGDVSTRRLYRVV